MDSPAPILHVLSLCSGVDGLALGLGAALEWCGLGARVVVHVEREGSACGILAARMAEGSLERAPVWSDLRTFDGRPWRGVVDCLLAGYPCQPFSLAGKRQGEADPRHLFPEVLRIIDETGPAIVFLENVAAHLRLGFASVRGALEARGYRVQAGLFSALEVGASHRRERLFILAYLPLERREGRGVHEPAGWLDPANTGRGLAELGHSEGDDQRRIEQRAGARRQVAHRGSSCLLGHAPLVGRREGRAQPVFRGGRDAPANDGGSLADAQHGTRRTERQLEPGRRANTSPADLAMPGGTGDQLADPSKPRLQGAEPSRAAWRGEPGPRGDLFAPGPGDTCWPDILADHPHLAPAVEPGLRVFFDGTALVVDQSRADQLRAAGNGVVPLCAAHAFVTLGRRAGLI